jgi:3-phenylpropionate/trans-cinnamate dioxygenase ferredoxin reductase subunit
MPAEPTFVIVGAALAGAKAAEALREQGFGGQIVLIGAERHHPYERPPLSKEYLQGAAGRETIFVHEDSWYALNSIDLRLGTAVTAIDRSAHQVMLDGGERIGYAKLLLATGSTPRRLTVPGADADGVLYLRTVDDSDRIREALGSASRVAVVGAGWIGLEVTAAARNAGAEVTVLEEAELPLLRALGPEVAPVFVALHRDHGVDFRFGARVSEIMVSGARGGGEVRATGVRLADGTEVGADAVIVGIGAAPASGLAGAAGLEVISGGVVTDAALRTSDPDIFAAGDIARAFHPLLRRPIRVEHWANALNQPATAARAMLGQDVAYDRLPYFYTDQYDLGMEYSGYAEPGEYDRVVFRGDVRKREFVAFWLSGELLLAGMNVNVWDVNQEIQRLISEHEPVSPRRLADPAVPLEETALRPRRRRPGSGS